VPFCQLAKITLFYEAKEAMMGASFARKRTTHLLEARINKQIILIVIFGHFLINITHS
jgi:hypothetical protein